MLQSERARLACPAVVPEIARCLDCGYLLRDLPRGVCPECGRAFDPDNPRSYRTPRTPWWRSWAYPPPLWHVILAIAVTVLVLDAASMPAGGSTTGLLVACTMCMGTVAVWSLPIDYLGRAVSVAICQAHGEPPPVPPRVRRRRWRWYVTPICVALVVSAWSGWPMAVRFALSRRALEAAALSFMADNPVKTPFWAGLYRVERMEAGEEGGVDLVTGDSIADPVGFEYRPDSSDARPSIAPGWYPVEW